MSIPKIQYEEAMRHLPEARRMMQDVISVIRRGGLDPSASNISTLFKGAFGMHRNQTNMLEAMVRYELAGQQAFIVGPGMRTAFANTKLDGASFEDLHLPHDAFYIALPECDWKIWGGQETGWHRVCGMYAVREQGGVTFSIWGEGNEKSVDPGDDAHAWIRLIPGAFESIENYMRETFEYGALPSPFLAPAPDEQVQNESIASAVRVAISLCMYLTCEGAETTHETNDERRAPLLAEIRRKKNPGKAKVLERRLAQLSTAAITRIGGRHERKMCEALRSETGEVRKHIVRGFFNTFWTGQGRTVKRRKWVYPFVRGTKDPAYESRQYVLAEPKTGESS